MFGPGKSLPEELRATLKELTNQTDWTIVAHEENKVSAYTIRDILKGMIVSEQSYSTVLKLIEFAKEKIISNEEKLSGYKEVLENVLSETGI